MSGRLLTVTEAASYLGLSRRELMARVRRGEIGCVRDTPRLVTCRRIQRGREQTFTYQRGLVRFRPRDLEAWVESRYAPAASAPTPERPAAPRVNRPWEGLGDRARRYA